MTGMFVDHAAIALLALPQGLGPQAKLVARRHQLALDVLLGARIDSTARGPICRP